MEGKQELKKGVASFVHSHRSATVAVGSGEEVRAFAVSFAHDAHYIYFFIFEKTEAFRLLKSNGRVAIAIDDGFRIPMKGVELVGSAKVLRGIRERWGQITLEGRFPLMARLWGHSALRIIQMQPEKAVLIDWEEEIGHREEVALGWGDLAT